MKVGDKWIDMTWLGIEFRGRVKSYIGLLHLEYDLFPHRTVLDNLTDAMGPEFLKELAVRKAVVTLKMVRFTEARSKELLDRLPGHLSEGERIPLIGGASPVLRPMSYHADQRVA